MDKIKFEAELSYYYLYLLSYLKENQPKKAKNIEFIQERSNLAAEAFEQARIDGYTTDGAQELAMTVLLDELHFSSYNMVSDILQKEFMNEIKQNKISELTSKILPKLDNIFSKYQLSDELITSAEYESLYNELTGSILILLEDGI